MKALVCANRSPAWYLILCGFLSGGLGHDFSRVPAPGPVDDPPTVVVIVRHAEKTSAADDPPLTGSGQVRARLLARMLGDLRLTAIHSSDTTRTRDTAAPLARQRELDISLYDPGDQRPLVNSIREAGGHHLVVGHSNTVRQLVELLGGDPGDPIDEAGEYDRLYLVTIGGDQVSTVLLRFGEPAGGR